MSINPEQWKQRRAEKEQQRKEKEAKQRTGLAERIWGKSI